MNVILVSSDYLPNIGGIASHVDHLSRYLVKLGAQVAVINPIAGETDSSAEWEHHGVIIKQIIMCRSSLHYKNKTLRKRLIAKRVQSVYSDLQNQWGDIHIVHEHDFRTCTKACQLLSKQSAWIWTNHTSRATVQIEKPSKKFILKKTYADLAGAVAVSQAKVNETKKIINAPVACIPNGVDIEKFSPSGINSNVDYGFQQQAIKILCPSRMVDVKGVKYFAQAASKLLNDHAEISWQFIFVGSDLADNTNAAVIHEVKEILQEHQAYTVFLGNIEPEKMPSLYAAVDLVVIPSLYESFGIASLEALAMEKVLIATDVGGHKDFLEDGKNCKLVPPADSEVIYKTILEVARDLASFSYLGKEGRSKIAAEYSWESVCRRVLELYDAAVS